MEHFDESELQALAHDIAAAIVEKRTERRSWDRWIQIVLGLATGLSLVFSLGLNWGRIGEVERRMQEAAADRKVLEERLLKVETTTSAQDGELRVINEKLNDIRQDTSEIKGRLNQR